MLPFPQGGSRDTFGKRIFDIAISSFLLILLAPLIGLIAIAIKLISSGPVFYRQVRVGKGARRFQMLKFRSMVQNADRLGGWSTQTDDPRITRVGKILRFSSLDELPQLVNVLRGEMSLVGPRPSVPNQLSEYTEEQRRIILSVRPGITGLAQVSGRSALTSEEQIACNVDYVLHWTFVLDLKILLKTMWVVATRQGVN
jgi:lipopolysaccharide/colanic/teichoic acid biosynthesis glycosyltransferase